MTLLKLNFHELIDKIENDEFLFKFYEIMENANNCEAGSLWNKLSDSEKQELINIEKDSHSENLIHHSVIQEKYKKWLL
jgi:hypothetical protein